MELNGRVAVVTGAAGGIGAALASRFLADGAKVVITDLDEARLAEQKNALAAAGPVEALAGDAASAEHIASLDALASKSFGAPVDIYVANAGVAVGTALGSAQDWATAIDVNLMAHVRAAQYFVPGWVERGEGYFVSTASAAGLLTQIDSATYATTKHAAVAFSEWLSVTYGNAGVRVSCLCPMGVETHLLEESGGASRVAQRAVTESGPILSPEQVASDVVEAMAKETFLVLPHANVLEMYRGKGADYDRWIRGMRKFSDYLYADN